MNPPMTPPSEPPSAGVNDDDLAAFGQREIADAHAACDGPVSRMSGDRVRPLAERVSCLRQMLTAVWREIPEVEPEEPRVGDEEELNDDLVRIVIFFVGAIVGVFIAVGFLALG